MPGPFLPDPTPAWLKPENASVTDSALTKAMRMIGHLIGADNPTAQVLGLMTTSVPSAGPGGGIAGALERLVQKAKLYHGSPNMLLSEVSASPPVRQFENGQSQLGAFFTLDEQEAARYAKGGRVYAADVPLKNPRELSWTEFSRFNDITKDASGRAVPSHLWEQRNQELIGEARAFRQQLEAAGHDGIVVRDTRGNPIEIASFKSVPLAQRPLPFLEQLKAIKAYHGSPHDFERFSMEKIGTGEGAQAYGHGLYFAEKEGTARSYRESLSSPKVLVMGQEQPVPNWHANMSPQPRVIRRLADQRAINPNLSDADIIAKVRADIQHEGLASHLTHEEANHYVRQADILDAMEQRGLTITSPGKMYEVAIHADPETFLDWDKPLSQQGEAVQKAIKQTAVYKDRLAGHQAGVLEHPDKSSGASWLSFLRDEHALRGGSPFEAPPVQREAEFLLKREGIPGIKYLDQGSRAAREGSRNYVVFDDSLVEILKKYGIAVPVIEGLRQTATRQQGVLHRDQLPQGITQ